MFRYLIICYPFLTLCTGWIIRIDNHERECFYERAEKNMKLGLIFQVIDGGLLDIDIKIHGPDGHDIYVGNREFDGRFAFVAYEEGKYEFCFSNVMSTVTPKSIMFNILLGKNEWSDEEPSRESPINSSQALQAAVKELSRNLWNVNSEQDYMIVRTNMHRRISEETNSVVVRWCIFEVLLIIGGTFFEVWYIKRFFEVQRVA